MKKIFAVGVISVAVLSLTGCTNSGAAAKKDFTKFFSKLNNKKYNDQDVKIKVNQLEASDATGQALLDSFKGTSVDVKSRVNYDNKVMKTSIDLNSKVFNDQLDFIFSHQGTFINSAGIKTLYPSIKPLFASKMSGEYTSIIDSMITELNKPYLLLDQKVLGNTSNIDTILKEAQQADKSQTQLNDLFKNIPDSAFSEKGDIITAKISKQDMTAEELLKGLQATSSNSTIDQQLQKNADTMKNLAFKNLEFISNLNTKTHVAVLKIKGEILDKAQADNLSIKFDIELTRTSTTDKAAVQAPALSSSQSLEDLQKAYLDKVMTQNK